MFPLLLGQTSEKKWGGWARGSRRSIFLTIENNGLHIKFSRILPCMLCNALFCKGVLSKDFEYVPLQHKQSYRFQDLARDYANLIFGHCEALCAPQDPAIARICVLCALKKCNFQDFCAQHTLKNVAISRIFVLCAPHARTSVLCGLRSAVISRMFVLSALKSAAISKILKCTYRPSGGHGSLLWPLLLGLWVRPIQKGFCSWEPSGSGTEHKHRLTWEEGEPGDRDRYRYR